MSDEKRKKHETEECEEEECTSVQGCKHGRPVRVKPSAGCDPWEVTPAEDCKPWPVKIEQKHCDTLNVRVKGPVHVKQEEGDCWQMANCPERPFHVIVDNPPPGVQNDQFVFNGTTWEPLLTPSKFVPFVNVQVPSGSPGVAIWMPPPGLKFRLMGMSFTGSVAGRYTFRDGIAGAVLYAITLVANEPFAPPIFGNGIPSGSPGVPLYIEFNDSVTTVTTITGMVFGQEIP